MRSVLTIAGSDSSGGAGIQADLKTFAAHGVFGATAITAVTVQNTLGVTRVVPLSADLVVAQIDSVVTDIGVHAVKTGMLATAATVEGVASALVRHGIRVLVVDPVMIATTGQRLLDESALEALKSSLLPHASVVTPNVREAEVLAGMTIDSGDARREAARRILDFGVSAVIVTGGHFPTEDIVDLLYDGSRFTEYRAARVPSRSIHGTGCTFSASVAASLALGRHVEDAIPLAQAYVSGAIRGSPTLGRGQGVLNHHWSR